MVGRLPRGHGEVSGFVSSPAHPGVAWMVRDSGHPASLYSFELSGGSVRVKEFPVRGAANRDWEDVAYTRDPDGRGRLWVNENNSRVSNTKTIYEVREPNPRANGPATLLGTYRWDYPDGNHDTEALVALDGKLVVVAKTNPNRVYRFESPLSASGMNKPAFKGSLPAGARITLASLSADQRLLVTSSTFEDKVWVWQSASGLKGFLAGRPVFSRRMPPAQREAGDFFPYNSCNIYLISESSGIWRLTN